MPLDVYVEEFRVIAFSTKIEISYLLDNIITLFQGGSIIRLFHKELEAYMVAEGLFDDEVTEDGTYNSHLHICTCS